MRLTSSAIGPDNLAAALQLNPTIATLVKQVVIMGGVIDRDGNVSPVAEANIFCDPHAAERVMAVAWSVVMVGLDVTHQVVLSRELFERIRDNKSPHWAVYVGCGTILYAFMAVFVGFRDVTGMMFQLLLMLLTPLYSKQLRGVFV